MKKFLFALLVVLISLSDTFSQKYDAALGLRVGYPLSISYKNFTSDSKAIEIFGGLRPFDDYNEFRINAALQIHNDIDNAGYFRWYYGAGAGIAAYSFDNDRSGDGGASVTASGYLGVEATFKELPISISLDWVPTLYIGGFGSGFGAGYGALAARYTWN